MGRQRRRRRGVLAQQGAREAALRDEPDVAVENRSGAMLRRALANWQYKLASLLIAIGLYFYVSHVNDPRTAKQIDIPITLTNVPSGLVVSEAPSNVMLQVSGAASSLDSVTGSSYIATADLAGTHAGVNQPLRIVVTGTPEVAQDVTIESQSPKDSSVTMENNTRERFTIHVSFRKVAPAGLSYGSPKIVPPVATVEGPESIVSRVVRLVVYGDDAVGGEIVSPGMLDGFGTVVALDAQDIPVDGVNILPEQAEVRIPVMRESAVKELIVNASVAGSPSFPNEVTGVDVLPNRNSVTGPPDRLASTSVVDTAPIDITGATSDVTRSVPVNIPAGLSSSSPVSVSVTVHIHAASLQSPAKAGG